MSSSRELSDTLPCLLDPQDCQEKHQHLNCRRCGVAKKKSTHQLNLAQLVPQPDKIDPSQEQGKALILKKLKVWYSLTHSSCTFDTVWHTRPVRLIQFDTLVLYDLSRLSRRTPLAFQAKRIVPDLQKDLKRRLDRIVKNPVLVYKSHNFKNITR